MMMVDEIIQRGGDKSVDEGNIDDGDDDNGGGGDDGQTKSRAKMKTKFQNRKTL